jgi:hypothetical protein
MTNEGTTMKKSFLVGITLFAGAITGCGGSGDEKPAVTTAPTATVAAAQAGAAYSAPSVVVIPAVVSKASLGPETAGKLTLPLSSVDDIIGTLTFRTIWDCPYLAFLAEPGTVLVSPVDGVVKKNSEISEKDPLTGNTGGRAITLELKSGDTVDMYFGAGTTSDVAVGADLKRGDVIGKHSGTEMAAITLGFNTIMSRSSKGTCVSHLDGDQWVGGTPAVVEP